MFHRLNRHHEGDEEQQEKSVNTSMTEVPTKTATPNKGSYATVPVTTAVKQPSIQPTREPVIVPGPQQPVTNSAAPQLPAGIPSYSSQIEGLSVSQVLVNDVIVDLQTKAINESQQQYFHESTHDNFFGRHLFSSFLKKYLSLRASFSNLYSSTKSNGDTSIRP